MLDQEKNLEDFQYFLKKYGRKKATISSYSSDVRGFLTYLSGTFSSYEEIDSSHLLDYQDYLKNSVQAMDNSIRRKILALRQFFRFLKDRSEVSETPFDRIPIPVRIDDLPELLHFEKITKLLFRTHPQLENIKAQRDLAILYLIAIEGLKTSEIIQLKWDQVKKFRSKYILSIGGTRKRIVYLAESTEKNLCNYLELYLTNPKLEQIPKKDRNVFISFKGSSEGLISPKMTRHGLKFLLYEIGEKFGIPFLNAEMLRHFCIRYNLEHGLSPEDIMNKFGLKRLGIISRHFIELNNRASK